MQTPSIGRIVLYVFTADDARKLNHQTSEENRPGNYAQEGDIRPLLICRVWPPELYEGRSSVNGQVFIDGEGSIWKTSVHCDDAKKPGTWHWPEVATPSGDSVDRIDATGAPDLSAAVMLTQLELKARRLCHLIESLGASPDITLASVTCANIRGGLACVIEGTPPSPYLRGWLNGQSDAGTPPSGLDV